MYTTDVSTADRRSTSHLSPAICDRLVFDCRSAPAAAAPLPPPAPPLPPPGTPFPAARGIFFKTGGPSRGPGAPPRWASLWRSPSGVRCGLASPARRRGPSHALPFGSAPGALFRGPFGLTPPLLFFVLFFSRSWGFAPPLGLPQWALCWSLFAPTSCGPRRVAAAGSVGHAHCGGHRTVSPFCRGLPSRHSACAAGACGHPYCPWRRSASLRIPLSACPLHPGSPVLTFRRPCCVFSATGSRVRCASPSDVRSAMRC